MNLRTILHALRSVVRDKMDMADQIKSLEVESRFFRGWYYKMLRRNRELHDDNRRLHIANDELRRQLYEAKRESA